MTTIAYSNGILASDSQITAEGGSILGGVKKIYKNEYGALFGAAGDPGRLFELLEWFNQEECETKPLPEDLDSTDFLMIAPYGSIFIHVGGPCALELDSTFAAIGSGADIARGALDVGATAEEAVQTAAEYDAYTGGYVHIEILGNEDD